MYVHGSKERLLQTARGDTVDGLEVASVLKKVKKEKRLRRDCKIGRRKFYMVSI